jgi:type I restriction enzyme S subunit
MTQIELTPNASLTGKWKPYPDYKDSGVEWLGEIPAHWEVKRLKYVSYCLDGQRIPLNSEQRSAMQGDYPYWGANCIIDNVNRWLFNEELILLGEDGAPFFDSTKEVAFFVSGKIWVNNHAHVLRPKKDIYARFLAYTLNMVDYRAFIDGSTRDKLTQNDMNIIPIQYPSYSEQCAIAAFLDYETARNNALIAKKERLIELLQEKRAALISHAVTKGLDPTVPMKDSGVEWLGEIPVHWEVAPVYSRYNVQLGKMLNQEAIKGLSPAPYLRNVNIQWDYVDLSDILEMDFNPLERQKFDLVFGDLLVCEGGEVGRTAIWRGELTECYFQKAIHRVRPLSTQEDGRFLFYVLYAVANLGVFKVEGNKSTIVHLTAEKFKGHRFAFPSLTEQRSIILFLDRETAIIDALISRVREGIEKLKEYSSALISAAVTGKIDVKGEISTQGSEM